ncbi:unnamed protein product [Symbiodinium sp. CCMP2592]|nr:unnamed protein product [Symbiodinium sp. CCMP2592]
MQPFFPEKFREIKPTWATAVEIVLKKDAPALERWTEIEDILLKSRKCYKQLLQERSVCMEISIDKIISANALSFKQAVENGWEWLLLAAEVDAVLPSRASFVQEVMNAAQGVARTEGELELAMAMVTRAKLLEAQGLSIDWDDMQIVTWQLQCTEAPLLKFLHDFSLQYGASKSLKFARQERSHAMIRAAMIATNLTATKVVDKVARLQTKADLTRLTSKPLEESVRDWEEMLHRASHCDDRCAETCQGSGEIRPPQLRSIVDLLSMTSSVCVNLLQLAMFITIPVNARLCWEAAALPLQPANGRFRFGYVSTRLEFGSLAEVLELYETEMGVKSGSAVAAAATSTAASSGDAVAGDARPSLLMKLQGFAEGRMYKGKQKYGEVWPWKLEKITQSHGSFSLACPVSSAEVCCRRGLNAHILLAVALKPCLEPPCTGGPKYEAGEVDTGEVVVGHALATGAAEKSEEQGKSSEQPEAAREEKEQKNPEPAGSKEEEEEGDGRKEEEKEKSKDKERKKDTDKEEEKRMKKTEKDRRKEKKYEKKDEKDREKKSKDKEKKEKKEEKEEEGKKKGAPRSRGSSAPRPGERSKTFPPPGGSTSSRCTTGVGSM